MIFAGSVLEKLRVKRRVFLRIPVDVPFQMNLLESIWRDFRQRHALDLPAVPQH